MFKYLLIASSILGLNLAQEQVPWEADEIDAYMTETSMDPSVPYLLYGVLSCVQMECFYRAATRDDRWWTAEWDDFLLPENLNKHFRADWIIDGRRICKYRIRWFNGQWSNYYYPGDNDNVETHKDDGVWNDDSFNAGRRQWSLFADHTHYVCYCPCIDTEYCG